MDTCLAVNAIAALPTSLTSLSYDFTGAPMPPEDNLFDALLTWSGEHFAMLPRSLRYLRVSYLTEIVGEDLKCLPTGLQTLNTNSMPNVTKKSLRFLPIHCALRGPLKVTSGQSALKDRLDAAPLDDPDLRVVGKPFNWP